MKAKYVLVGIVVLALLYGMALYLNSRWFPATPPTLWLELTGTPGLKVAGTYSVDGVQTSFSGVLPDRIEVNARAFEFTICISDGEGIITGELFVSGQTWGKSSITGAGVGVTGGCQLGSGFFEGDACHFSTVSTPAK